MIQRPVFAPPRLLAFLYGKSKWLVHVLLIYTHSLTHYLPNPLTPIPSSSSSKICKINIINEYSSKNSDRKPNDNNKNNNSNNNNNDNNHDNNRLCSSINEVMLTPFSIMISH